jgi:hypothetical protein
VHIICRDLEKMIRDLKITFFKGPEDITIELVQALSSQPPEVGPAPAGPHDWP